MRKCIRSMVSFLFSLILVCGICCTMIPTLVSANQGTSEKCSITYDYEDIEGVGFRLYYVGKADSKGSYILSDEFKSLESSLDFYDTAAASTLAKYVKSSESIKPVQSKITDAQGIVLFDNLEQGVYLIIGDEATVDKVRYCALPILLELPSWNEAKTELTYDMHVAGKCETEPVETEIEISVTKVWKGVDENKEPENVTVELLRDGKVVDPAEYPEAKITLSKENNWSYTWHKLDGDYKWEVKENPVPEGYTVTIETKTSTEFVLVNTAKKPGGDKPNGPLPQTGQLWWPVMILVCAGLLALIIGIRLRRE